MSEMGFENVFYLENFECAGDEVLVESSPPPSPGMAARLAAPSQGAAGGGASPNVRELIVISEMANPLHIQHAIQQVSNSVVDVNGDSSGQSSPTAEPQHTYIVANFDITIKEENGTEDYESESNNGVNYHVQYVEHQEIYTQGHQPHIEQLRTYPVYGVTAVGESGDGAWSEHAPSEYAYNVVVEGEGGAAEGGAEGGADAEGGGDAANRMPPATVQWLLDNYETAEGVSLPRSTLYAHYLRHCALHRLEPVNAASFGKLIRSVFVGLRTRRLGTRGNSKYHYYGIRARHAEPERPPAPRSASPPPAAPAAPEPLYRQFLGAVQAPLPPPLEGEADDALARHHRDNGEALLQAAAALDAAGVERARRAFWRRPPPALAGRLRRLTGAKAGAAWLRRADLQLFQRAVELLLPDVLRPIPPALTQAVRNFAKSLEGALAAGGASAPPLARKAQASAAAALAGALRRYTSLNHLAQAARAVLANRHQIHQMVADLNRVDFRVVSEQAAWACSCGSAGAALRLEQDFKATLGKGATLEQWAAWLEGCVKAALASPERADLPSRARRLLLDWSFCSSLVIRELTLRSAASFGSFHLLRLLYDEYVSYVIERRVAQHQRRPPVAVMHNPDDADDDLDEAALAPAPAPAPSPAPEDSDSDEQWEWRDDDEDSDGKRPRLD